MPNRSEPVAATAPAAPAGAPVAGSGTFDVAVLGPVLVRAADGLASPGGARSRELLVALVLAGGRPVSSRSLLDDLWWAQDDLADPRAALQTVVSRTRRVAATGLLTSSPAGYALAGTSDLDEARRALSAASAALAAHDEADAAATSATGLALWRGEPGADLSPGSPLADALAAEALHVRTALQDVRLAALVAAGADDEVLELAGERLAHRPSDEAACLAAMTALARLGRTNDALRAFAALREALADELGADPGADVTTLHERLLRGEVPVARRADDGGPTAPGRVAGPGGRVGPVRAASSAIGLRAAPNPLVGRDGDVAALESALRASRLVTVLGPGGLGKTRIAQEVARRAAADGQGVVVVELASVRTDDDVELALATRLGVRDVQASARLGDPLVRPDTRARILDRLRAPGTLLVLDNCEHLLDGAARWTADVLADTGARVLTTSRAPLALAAETVYPLPALASRPGARGAGGTGPAGPAGAGDEDDAPGPAVVLFEQRARAARPDAPLPRDVVERLCDRLDGLPLAIELAAARVRSLSVVEIERRLAARFTLLTSGDRSAPERHRTLRAVIEWSWNLLGADERALLRRLSVLPGSFGSDTAEAVTAWTGTLPSDEAGERVLPDGVGVLDALDGLVSQSMLTVIEDPAAGAARYRMLETVREYGALELERKGETDAVREAVYAWARAFARAQRGRLTGEGQQAAVRVVSSEQENAVQVLRWAVEERRRDVLGPVFALLARLWLLRSQFGETITLGSEVADTLVGQEPTPAEAEDLVWVYIAAGSPLALMVDRPRALRSFARLRRILRADVPLSPATRGMVELMVVLPYPERVAAVLERLRGDTDWLAAFLGHLTSGQLAENAGQLDTAAAYAHRAYDLASTHGDVWGAAMAGQNIAELASETGHPEEALRWIAVARAAFAAIDAEAFLFQLDSLEASALVGLDRGSEALDTLRRLAASPVTPRSDALEDVMTAGDRKIVGETGLAHEAHARGEVREAIDRLDGVLRLLREQREPGIQNRVSTGAGRLSMAVLDVVEGAGAGREPASTPDERERWARDQRATTRAMCRVSGGFQDSPVVGASALALGAYLWSEPAFGRVDEGLELLALASALGSRQDTPVLRRARHRADAVATVGEAAVVRAEERARTAADPFARALELIEKGPWRRV